MKRAALALAAVLAASLLPVSESATAKRQLRVGLVLQSTYVKDPYEGGAFRGFRRAVRELGVAGGWSPRTRPRAPCRACSISRARTTTS